MEKESKINIFIMGLICLYGISILTSRFGMNLSVVCSTSIIFYTLKNKNELFNEKEDKLFIAIIILSSILNIFSDGGVNSTIILIRRLIRFFPILFFPFYLIKLDRIEKLSYSITISIGINFLYGIRNYFKNIQNVRDFRISGLKGIMETSHGISVLSFIVLGMLIYNIKEKNKKEAFYFFVVYILSLIILVLGKTRGVWIAFSIGILFFAFILSKKYFFCILISGILMFSFLLTSEKFDDNIYIQRIKSIKSTEDYSKNARIIIWKAAFETFKENYLLGVGKKESSKYYLEYLDKNNIYEQIPSWSKESMLITASTGNTHNMYLHLLVEQGGIIFLLAIVYVFYISFIFLKFIYTKIKLDNSAYIVLGSFCGTVSFFISGLTDNTLNNFWMSTTYVAVLSIGISCVRIAKKKEKYEK